AEECPGRIVLGEYVSWQDTVVQDERLVGGPREGRGAERTVAIEGPGILGVAGEVDRAGVVLQPEESAPGAAKGGVEGHDPSDVPAARLGAALGDLVRDVGAPAMTDQPQVVLRDAVLGQERLGPLTDQRDPGRTLEATSAVVVRGAVAPVERQHLVGRDR